ncbi:MAG: aspartate aminotransferase family protein [Rhodomicrobium sp.]
MLQALSRISGEDLYERHVNPQWVRLLDVLGMNAAYDRCVGAELLTSDGRKILDFNSGYCVHNIGHNHPGVIAALKDELDKCGPAMLQAHVPELAGELAARLCRLAGGRVNKVFFGSSGSEGVEAAIKFARAHGGRPGIVHASGAFHGLTCGALSLMSNGFWKDGFGSMLPATESVPFGDLEALERKLADKSKAAFIVEPIQAEGGVLVPTADYLPQAQVLCRRYGTLFVLDEVQTGLYRTGPFLAGHHFGVEPDIIILAKAISGGLVPCSAVLMSDAVYYSVYSTFKRALVHTSTFSENALAMRAGLAALDILEEERLGERAARSGEILRRSLHERLSQYEMFGEVRGLGLLNAIEFKPPRSVKLSVPFNTLAMIHPATFGQILVMRLFRDHGMLNQVCGNNFMTLKVSPPLIIEDRELDLFAAAIEEICGLMHTFNGFWTEAIGLAQRAFKTM